MKKIEPKRICREEHHNLAVASGGYKPE